MAFSISRRGEAEQRSSWLFAAFVLAAAGAEDRNAAATVTGFALGVPSGDGPPESFEGDAGDWGAGGRLGSSALGVILGAGAFVVGSSG